MIGVKEMCALLLAGGMGATSVVAVQEVKPVIAKKRAASAKPAVKRVSRPAPAPAPAAITDCPTQVAALSSPMTLPPLPDAELTPDLLASQTPFYPGGYRGPGGFSGPGGGGDIGTGGGPIPEPVSPAVPEPASWAMLISGFGLIGWALRRRPVAKAAE